MKLTEQERDEIIVKTINNRHNNIMGGGNFEIQNGNIVETNNKAFAGDGISIVSLFNSETDGHFLAERKQLFDTIDRLAEQALERQKLKSNENFLAFFYPESPQIFNMPDLPQLLEKVEVRLNTATTQKLDSKSNISLNELGGDVNTSKITHNLLPKETKDILLHHEPKPDIKGKSVTQI